MSTNTQLEPDVEEPEAPPAAPGFQGIPQERLDFLEVNPFRRYWIATREPGYTADFRGHRFFNGLCEVPSLPRTATEEQQARRQEFFAWFANEPKGYALYGDAPQRPRPVTVAGKDEEEW